MNKGSNYYTPKIEEFYEGFQYEINMYMLENYMINSKEELIKEIKWVIDLGVTSEPCQQHWLKNTYKITDKLVDINRIRVKYLNDEDLETCGFKTSKLPWQYHDGIHSLIDLGNNMIRIDHTADEQCLFYGKIKNLSELGKLLNQLGILY